MLASSTQADIHLVPTLCVGTPLLRSCVFGRVCLEILRPTAIARTGISSASLTRTVTGPGAAPFGFELLGRGGHWREGRDIPLLVELA